VYISVDICLEVYTSCRRSPWIALTLECSLAEVETGKGMNFYPWLIVEVTE
jgi:hypothetical protein